MDEMVCLECRTEYPNGNVFCPVCGLRLQDKSKLDTDNSDPFIGKTIDGRYTILGLLGTGGMGVVYRGVQKSIDRPVAVKLLRSELCVVEEVVRRFLHEARIASQLQHPHVVSLIDFGQEHEKLLYIVMELLEGHSLGDLLTDGSLNILRSLKIASQVCNAMEEAHSLKIIHRDLKPDNIFITSVGRKDFAKVLDFGIAKVLNAHTNLTKTGMIFGSPAYMSPEQARGLKIDLRTDIYSLGVILYEMLSGQLVFDTPDPVSLMYKHCMEQPIPLSQLSNPFPIPRELEALILGMLEKNPENRPQSMREVGSVIEHIINSDTGDEVYLLTPVCSRKGLLTRSHAVGMVDTTGHSETLEPVISVSGPPTIASVHKVPEENLSKPVVKPEKSEGIEDIKETYDGFTGFEEPINRRRWPLLMTLIVLIVGLGIWKLFFSEPSTFKQEHKQETSVALVDDPQPELVIPRQASGSSVTIISTITIASWKEVYELFQVEVNCEPKASLVSKKGKKFGKTPVSLNLLEDFGPFVLRRKNYTSRSFQIADLIPGSNTFELKRKKNTGSNNSDNGKENKTYFKDWGKE